MPLTPSQRQTRSNSNPNNAVTLADIKLLIESSVPKMMASLEEKIDRLATSLSTVLARMDDIDKKYVDIEQRCRRIEEEQINVFTEIADRRRREPNLIISGIPEEENGTVDERRRWDEKRVESLLQDLNSFNSNIIASVHRIGRITSRKPRLVKVVCRNVEAKRSVIAEAQKLRRMPGYGNVYVNPDQTPLEQSQSKALRGEYNRRKACGEDVIIRHGKIISKQNFH